MCMGAGFDILTPLFATNFDEIIMMDSMYNPQCSTHHENEASI